MALDITQLRLVLYFAIILNSAIFLIPEKERILKNILLCANLPLLHMLSVFAASDAQGFNLGYITYIIGLTIFLRTVYYTLTDWLPTEQLKRRNKVLGGKSFGKNTKNRSY